jgi:diaminopimelate decarboxylase
VTPGIDAATHAKIRTGHASSKFGMAPADVSRAIERAPHCPHLRLDGLHVHLGSQIRDLGTYVEAVDWLARFPGIAELPVLDIGGGLAIAYTDDDQAPEIRTAVEHDRGAPSGSTRCRSSPSRPPVAGPGATLNMVGREGAGGSRSPSTADVRQPYLVLYGAHRRGSPTARPTSLTRPTLSRQALRVGRR